MKTEYIILETDSHYSLQDKVNQAIAKGWEPLGGIAALPKEVSVSSCSLKYWGFRFYQSMTRKVETD